MDEGAFSLLVSESMAFHSIDGKSGKIELVHNLIESVDFENQSVILTGRVIKYSVLVVATGMARPEVFSFGNRLTNKSSREDLLTSVDSFKESVYSSQEIEKRLRKQRKLIAGSKGGAVVIGNSKAAVELAATLKDTQGESYQVSLVTPEKRLVPEFGESDSEKLLNELKSLGVSVRLNCASGYADAATVSAVVLDCSVPSRPNTDFLQATSVLDENGFVLCDEKLRIKGGMGIEFAVGSLVSGGSRSGDASVVAKNVCSLLLGKVPSATRGQKKAKAEKVSSVALGAENFYSVGLFGKIETRKRAAIRHEVAVGQTN